MLFLSVFYTYFQAPTHRISPPTPSIDRNSQKWEPLVLFLLLKIRICESTSIDKDAMALKVFQVIIFLITFVKYTCLRRKNSKTMKIIYKYAIRLNENLIILIFNNTEHFFKCVFVKG